VVLQYDSRSPGLPTSSGFTHFAAEIPDSAAPGARYHRVTVIGLMAANAPWRVLLSIRTAARIAHPAYITFINTYLFRVAPGASEVHAARALSDALDASTTGITVQSLDHGDQNGITAVFTLFLGGDLALGLLFGALAIGVISGRSVVERRQQIGMVRALGFSRGLVRRAFLLEASGVITLGLVIGAVLALWLAAQVAQLTGQDIPLPLGPIALILAGSYVVAVLSTVWPARQAARLPPAEALRYE
jgi:ABC-type antimicrobial peptide transport system permease subunit